MKRAQIQGGIVVNVIEVNPNDIPDFAADWPDAQDAGPGWSFSAGTFSPPPPMQAPPPDPRIVGVEFEGVMCSATAEDQNGLAAVLVAIQFQGAAFAPTRFYFANGNTIVLSLDNYQAFAAVWLPFRQSFFTPAPE